MRLSFFWYTYGSTINSAREANSECLHSKALSHPARHAPRHGKSLHKHKAFRGRPDLKKSIGYEQSREARASGM